MRVLSTSLVALLGLALAGTASAQLGNQKPNAGTQKPPIVKDNGSPPSSSGSRGGGGMFVSTNDCTSPTAISGPGSHPFDTTVATTSGFNGGGTCASGASTLNQDLFWQWTANAAGNYQFDTFGSLFDTQLSVHAGVGCAAVCVGYNDDTGGLQSRVLVNGVNAGDTFVLQVGGYGSHSGTGSLNITHLVPPTNDTCSTATAISGSGTTGYHTGLASTSGFSGTGTCGGGAGTLNQDVFYQWTATAPGDYRFDTFGSTFDTQLSVHAGVGCGAVCVGYNDDTGGLQSQVLVYGINAGDTFLVQVGGYGTQSGSGVLNIGAFVDPCTAPPDQFEPNDSCAQAVPIGDGTYLDLTVTKTNSDFYEVNVADGATLTVELLFIHATADVDIFLYDPLNCQDGDVGTSGALTFGFSASNNEFISWTNTTGSAQTYKIKVNVWPSSSGDCNFYDMIVTGAGPGAIGTGFCSGDGSASPCPCGNFGLAGRGCDNGTGAGGALLSAGGDVVVGSGNLVLMGEGLEPSTPGLYYQGNNAVNGGMGLAFGDGLRCVGGGVIRVQVRVSNVNGESSTTIDIAAKGGVAPGDVRRYQLWYRNTNFTLCGSGFNLSNGLEIVWQ